MHYCSSTHNLIILSSPISGCQPYQSYKLQHLYQQKRNSLIDQSQLVVSYSRFRLRTSIHFYQSHWSDLSENLYLPLVSTQVDPDKITFTHYQISIHGHTRHTMYPTHSVISGVICCTCVRHNCTAALNMLSNFSIIPRKFHFSKYHITTSLKKSNPSPTLCGGRITAWTNSCRPSTSS